MNKPVTTREAILAVCREMVMEKGIAAINMRDVAAECKVALGSLYNYFPSKSHLIIAAVDSVWTDIFFSGGEPPAFTGFLSAVAWFFESLERSKAAYPGFFGLHAMGFAVNDKAEGRQVMGRHFARISEILLDALNRDPKLPPETWANSLSPEGVVSLAFDAVLAAALQGKDGIGALLALLARALYPA